MTDEELLKLVYRCHAGEVLDTEQRELFADKELLERFLATEEKVCEKVWGGHMYTV